MTSLESLQEKEENTFSECLHFENPTYCQDSQFWYFHKKALQFITYNFLKISHADKNSIETL